MNSITYVGLDVHKATVSVAIAESGRGGEVREVGVFEKAMRDLVRARATAVGALSKALQHLQGFLLRHDRIYHGAAPWTLAYRR